MITIRTSNLPLFTKARNIALILLGVVGFLFKRNYAGPFHEIVHNYGGNITISFALYFILFHLPLRTRWRRPFTAGITLVSVESFEVFDGFGVMMNTYDPIDLIANGLGVALAWAVDAAFTQNSGSTADIE